jgi:hypothetical protein
MEKETYNRLVQERKELSEKYNALLKFVRAAKFQELSLANKILLNKQLNAMLDYLQILDCRIEINTPQECNCKSKN